MLKLILNILAVIIVITATGIGISYSRQQSLLDKLMAELQTSTPTQRRVDFAQLSQLPAPVQRYFRHVLQDGQPAIRQVTLFQSGRLRTDTQQNNWFSFTARQTAVPGSGFIWDADIQMPFGVIVQVIDAYSHGEGFSRLNLAGAIPLATEQAYKPLNSGALHRYLAESVWYPTALLPAAGVQWQAVDNRTAIATLEENGIKVSLQFSFNDNNEITAIYTPERYGKFETGYSKKPWEGHFSDYRLVDGVRIPMNGEVGWYENDKLEFVWKGDIENIQYQFD